MLKFKVGDKVKILTGKDKGRDGVIEKLLLKKNRAVIPGLNEYKKHMKPRSGQKGGIVSIPRPIGFGKLQLICPLCQKPARVGIRVLENEKVRFCKKCKREINEKKK